LSTCIGAWHDDDHEDIAIDEETGDIVVELNMPDNDDPKGKGKASPR
jgi:hypothetical protein